MAEESADKPRSDHRGRREREGNGRERPSEGKDRNEGKDYGDTTPAPMSSEGPDVYLNVPVLKVDEIAFELDNLEAHVSLNATVLDLLKLNVGADVFLGKVNLEIKGVEAEALLEVRLDNVAVIIGRVLTTLDRNPEILRHVARGAESALRGAGEAVEDVGKGANQAVGELGKGAGGAVEDVGKGAGEAVEDVGKGTGQAVGELGKGAGGAVEDVGKGAGEAVEGVGKGAGEAVEDVGKGTGQAVEDVGEDVGEGAGKAVGEIGETGKAAAGALGGVGQGGGRDSNGNGKGGGGRDSGGNGDRESAATLHGALRDAQESVDSLRRVLQRMQGEDE